MIDYWDDTKLAPGADWDREIENAMKSARVAVLLVSADFLASPYIAEKELPKLLEAAQRDGAEIYSVILSPSAFEHTRLRRYQAVHNSGKPLSKMSRHEREEVWAKLASLVANALNRPGARVNEIDKDDVDASGKSSPPPGLAPQAQKSTQVTIHEGLSLISQENYHGAADILQQATLRSPQDFEAWFNYAVALAKMGQHHAAENALSQAFEISVRRSSVPKSILVADDDATIRDLLRVYSETMIDWALVD